MTRKDYERTAAILAWARMRIEHGDSAALVMINLVSDIAGMFADDNPRFDRERFLEATHALDGK